MHVPEDLFFPATQRFSVIAVVPHDYLVMLDLEHDPPVLIFEGPRTAATGEIETRPATAEELDAIETWVASLHP